MMGQIEKVCLVYGVRSRAVSIKLLKESYGDQIAVQEKSRQQWENQRQQIALKIKRLLDLYIENSLDEKEYSEKRLELLNEKLKYDELITNADQNNTGWLKRAEEFFGTLRTVHGTFKEGNIATRKQVVSQIGWNLLLKDGELQWEYRKPFHFLIATPKLEEVLSKSVGTQDIGSTEIKNTPAFAEVSLWRATRVWYQDP